MRKRFVAVAAIAVLMAVGLPNASAKASLICANWFDVYAGHWPGTGVNMTTLSQQCNFPPPDYPRRLIYTPHYIVEMEPFQDPGGHVDFVDYLAGGPVCASEDLVFAVHPNGRWRSQTLVAPVTTAPGCTFDTMVVSADGVTHHYYNPAAFACVSPPQTGRPAYCP